MAAIAVFPATRRSFNHYLGDESAPDRGMARIACLVGADLSNSIGAGVVIYEHLTIDWNLAFDEVIVVLEGAMSVSSGGMTYHFEAGDVAWFPAHAAVSYDVADRVVVFYATYPIASTLRDRGTVAKIS